MFQRFVRFDSVPTTTEPSIDRVIDRVHIVAGNINELTHVVDLNAKMVAEKGGEVLDRFNVRFADVSAKVGEMIEVARERTYGIPVGIFYAVLICALILIALSICYLISFGAQRILRKRYSTLDAEMSKERVI